MLVSPKSKGSHLAVALKLENVYFECLKLVGITKVGIRKVWIIKVWNLFIITNMARDLFTVLQVPHQLPARMFRPEHFHVIRTFFCAMARRAFKRSDCIALKSRRLIDWPFLNVTCMHLWRLYNYRENPLNADPLNAHPLNAKCTVWHGPELGT